MSYSVCLNCKRMVARYDKYCPACQQKHGLPNLPDFQRGWIPQPSWEIAAQDEVNRDLADAALAEAPDA